MTFLALKFARVYQKRGETGTMWPCVQGVRSGSRPVWRLFLIQQDPGWLVSHRRVFLVGGSIETLESWSGGVGRPVKTLGKPQFPHQTWRISNFLLVST